MKIAGIIRQDSGVGWYRIINPLMACGRSGVKYATNRFTGQNEVATIGKIDDKTVALDDKTLMSIAEGADIIWSTIILDHNEILKILDLREWSGAKWVVDMDDDMYNVSVANPMRKNVEQLLPNIEMCLQLADGLTVSTPRLKEVYAHLNPNIHVIKNGQNIKEWNKLPMSHNIHKGVRIGWRGASGHQADVALIEPAIKALKKDYDITLVTLGVENNIESEHHKWVGCMDFPRELAKLDLDMAIVPLVDSQYNKCKSNIAVQEFGALKIPVVASPVENQLDMPVGYAKTNFEWYTELEKLIKNKKYRKQMGENLYNHIRKEWQVDNFVPDLLNYFKELPRKDHKPQ